MKVGEKTPTQLGPLERANFNHWLFLRGQLSRCLLPHLHLRTETDPVSETACSLEYQTMEKVQKPRQFMRFKVFWDVRPRRYLRRFRRKQCVSISVLKAARSSETLVNIYQISRRHSPVVSESHKL
jgi:hypothetical protein